MDKESKSYKQVFKATSIFGGVQVFNILIAVLRSKLVAVLLGPAGMGIVSLFTTTIGLITGITNFGLGTSAVKNIAAAEGSGNNEKLGKTVAVFRRLIWITGGGGFVLTLILAPWLSELAFKDKSYTLGFLLVSVTLLFSQISHGQNVILRGMRKIQFLAKASMFGALGGLLISIPLYYFFGENGIVPAIILTSVSTLSISWFYANKVKIPIMTIDKEIFQTEGKEMLKMGFLISMSGLIAMGTAYIVRIFISNSGSLVDVGLFTAGFSIIGTYAGMVFTAMSTDYYPRLSAVANDNIKCNEAINQQAEIALLILAPILIIFLVFVQWGVILLYSKEFLGIVDMLLWATLGVFFKALSWCIGFVFLAKSATKVYFWNELTANAYILVFNIIGYKYFGLTGLGVSFLIAYLIYFIQVFLVSKSLYRFSMSKVNLQIFGLQFLIAVVCFFVVNFLDKAFAYPIGIVLIFLSGLYSWRKLNKRINITEFILNKVGNRKVLK